MFENKTNLLEQVWQKAGQIPGMDPENFRMDEQGSVISKNEYNNESSIYGWCLNHLRPFWEGGRSELANVTPLNCTNKLISLSLCINPNNTISENWD